MTNPPLVTDQFYHIYNRGVEKRNICLDKWDYSRFLESLNFYHMFPIPIKLSDFRRGKIGIKKIEEQHELVRIHCFCLMPNHFHLLVEQLEDGGLTMFLRRFADSYTRFFNTKYGRVGPLFQGKFKARSVDSEEYLLQLSKYIHKNPFPLPMWEGKVYPYSSYGWYLSKEKHPFCDTETILSYFSKTNPNLSYQSFVEESEIEDPAVYSLSIDFEDS